MRRSWTAREFRGGCVYSHLADANCSRNALVLVRSREISTRPPCLDPDSPARDLNLYPTAGRGSFGLVVS